MILRKNCLPRRPLDAVVTLFSFVIVPVVYFFELFVVLPEWYPQPSLWYLIHSSLGTFLMYNVTTNLIAVIICDTSIKGRTIKSSSSQLNYCEKCQSTVPLRAWHCKICRTCILKRDHHCMFTGCCIGHSNHRFFLMFVFYTLISTCYATYFNVFYGLDVIKFNTGKSWFQLLFPLMIVFMEWTKRNLSIAIIGIVVQMAVFTFVLLVYHFRLILEGKVCYENKINLNGFTNSKIDNLIETFGDRWYLVWVSPFTRSKLPHNGTEYVFRKLK